eukprot:668490-Rhodomonas_salina.2
MAWLILALPTSNKQGGWGMMQHARTCWPACYATYVSFLAQWAAEKVLVLAAPSAQFSIHTDL